MVAIGVYLAGLPLRRPRADRLGVPGREIGAAGGAPTAAQVAELQKLDKEMSQIGRVDFVLLMIAALAMAPARYWSI